MKKIVLLLVVLLSVAAVGLYFVQTRQQESTTGFARYLPADTPLVLNLRDLAGLSDRFPDTALGHLLSKETMTRVLADLGAPPEQIREYGQAHDQIFALLHNPVFRMVFGDDTDLALLAPDVEQLQQYPQETLRRSLVILATTSSSSTLQQVARGLSGVELEDYPYEELDLTRIRLDQETYVYTWSRSNRLLLAFDPAAVRRCVQAADSGQGLDQVEGFRLAAAFFSKTDLSRTYLSGFVQLDLVREMLSRFSDRNIRESGSLLAGMRFSAFSAGSRTDGWGMESRTSYNYQQLHPMVRELVDSASTENSTLGLVRESDLLYSWSSTLGRQRLLEILAAGEPEEYRALDARLQRETGFSLQQVVGGFGPQYGLLVREIVQAGIFPLPRLLLFLEVRDHQMAAQLLDILRRKADERGMAAEQQEQVGGYTIHFWPLMPGEATQPALVLTDNMLYVANGPATLREILEQGASRPEPASDPAEMLGAGMARQVREAGSGVMIFRPDRFARQVRGALDWLAGMVTLSDGRSVQVLKDELLTFLQSGEVAVFVSDLQHESARAVVALKEKTEKEEKR